MKITLCFKSAGGWLTILDFGQRFYPIQRGDVVLFFSLSLFFSLGASIVSLHVSQLNINLFFSL